MLHKLFAAFGDTLQIYETNDLDAYRVEMPNTIYTVSLCDLISQHMFV